MSQKFFTIRQLITAAPSFAGTGRRKPPMRGRVLSYLRAVPHATARQTEETVGISRGAASSILEGLAGEGLAERLEGGRFRVTAKGRR